MSLKKRSVQIKEQEQVEKYVVRCNLKDLVMTFCLFTSCASNLWKLPVFCRLVITVLKHVY